MKHTTKSLLAATLATTFSYGAVAQSLTVGWDAASYDNNGTWEVDASEGGSAATMVWNGTGTLVNAANTNFANISDYLSSPSYELPGGSDSWHDILGDAASKVDSVWEFVLRPGDFTGTHPIFDTGGSGSGTGVRMIGNNLNFRFQSSGTAFLELNADLSAIGASSDFYHVVAIQDVNNAASASALYVNGQLIDSGGDTSGILDWDGSDKAGLGKVGGTSPQGASFTGNFDGDLAIVRNYNNQLITNAQVKNLFAATTGNRNLATIGWDAADYDEDGTWETSESDPNVPSAGNTTWHGTGTKNTGSTNFANVNTWISSPSFTQGNLTSFSSADDAFDDELGGAFSNRDTSFELVFRPGDFTGNHLLMDHGGNVDGTSIDIAGSTLRFTSQDGGGSNAVSFTVDLSSIGTADQFFHVVAVTDTDNPNAESGLYVNGVLVGGLGDSAIIADWAGGDGGGLGKRVGTSAGADGGYATFTGDIAIYRIYNDQAFDQAAVDAAYNDVAVPEPSSLALLGLGGLALMRRRRA